MLVRAEKGPDRALQKSHSGFMVALMVPEEFQEAVANAAGVSKKTWPGEMHLTLNYIDDKRYFADVVRIVEQVAKEFDAFELTTTAVGFFLPEENKLVHWVGADAPDLRPFQAQLKSAMKKKGIPVDTKYPFYKPHITIQYIEGDYVPEVQRVLKATNQLPPVKFLPTLAVVDNDEATEVKFGGPSLPAYRRVAAESALQALAEIETTAGASSMGRHMVRAIYGTQRKRGQNPKQAAQGAFAIATSVMKDNGYAGAGKTSRLTAKGGAHSKRNHANEPVSSAKRKDQEFQVVKNLARDNDNRYSSKAGKFR